jgi:PAS domain S-box-containing protein
MRHMAHNDITERKQAEAALCESERSFRAVFDNIGVGMLIVSLVGVPIETNQTFQQMLGYTADELRAVSLANLTHPDDVESGEQLFKRMIRGEIDLYRIEKRYFRKDGSLVWANLTVSLICDDLGRPRFAIGMVEDLTQRKRMDEALVASEMALRESHERIEYLAGSLIISQEEERKYIARELHDDLNQEVAALALGLGRLNRRLRNADAPIRKQLDKLEDQVTRLSEQIRKLSHELHSSTLEHVGLSAALRMYCSEFAELQGISVNLKVEGNIEPVPAEAALCFYRVAQESLRNIAKHSGADTAEVAMIGHSESIELRVSDEGKGFNRDEVKEGRGLGLVSIEERVKLLRGSFELNSQPGMGTELRVSIPRM